MIFTSILDLTYLLGALAIVLGLQKMSTPDTARKGNILAAIGMGIAIIATLIYPLENANNNYIWIFGGMLVGGIIGWLVAKKVEMTNMPQMVSIFNGLGGACAVVLAMVELEHFFNQNAQMTNSQLGIILTTLFIGAVAFSGSMLAYLKLDGKVWDKHVTLPKHNIVNIILLLITLGLGGYVFFLGGNGSLMLAIIFMVVSLIYGFSFVAPIGGADMPVVISLLNSFTGLSAAAAGLIYGNQIMLVGGILVGASGTILTVVMCNAMNRSLLNVLIGNFGGGGGAAAGKGTVDGQTAKEVSIDDAAIQLFYSKNVVVVPGYGLAVAQAQKVCKDMDDILSKNGVNVTYAIHPVAGRMPGHMNVLLAEADVPYPKLLDLDDANSALPSTDVVVMVIGANDVVNPSALDDPSSPVYGMPVLHVWEAKSVIVLKRSMRPGYSGIQNPLFFHDKTKMLFGDAKDSLQKLVQALKENA